MSAPVVVDIPHKLGRQAARDRIEKGIGKLAGFIPGGNVTDHRWDADTLTFTIEAMGQRISSRLEVLEDKVHGTFELPAMLSLFAEKIRAKLAKEAPKLLE